MVVSAMLAAGAIVAVMTALSVDDRAFDGCGLQRRAGGRRMEVAIGGPMGLRNAFAGQHQKAGGEAQNQDEPQHQMKQRPERLRAHRYTRTRSCQ